jgi:hypothetical protein
MASCCDAREVRQPLFEYTDFHQTNTHLYVFGYSAVSRVGHLLRISQHTSQATGGKPKLEVESDEREYTVEEYNKELKRLQDVHHGNLQPVAKVRLISFEHVSCQARHAL